MNPISLFKCDLDKIAISDAAAVLSSGQVAAGPHVSALEKEMAWYFEGRDVVAMGDMTHALSVALRLSGVDAGDDVLVLSYNCLSSTSAISAVGALPVWLDIDPASATVTIAEVVRACTPRTKALVVYHVAGYPADLVSLKEWADQQGVALIEDANNALGSRIGNIAIGTVGRFAVVSLYANRQVNGVEGGLLICERSEEADEARRLRRFGINLTHFRDRDGEIDPGADVSSIGVSSSLTNVNAVIARAGLASLNVRLQKVRENVSFLQNELRTIPGLSLVSTLQDASPAYWVLLVLSETRDKLLRDLKVNNVQCSKLHHPNHLYTGFHTEKKELPGTEEFMRKVLALPCGWWLKIDELQHIVQSVRTSQESVVSTH